MQQPFGTTVELEDYANLSERKMTHEQYTEYTNWYVSIQNEFVESREKIKNCSNFGISPVTKETILCASGEYANVNYGDTTLKEDGCAIFCIEHAARSLGKKFDIIDFAKVVTEKGYHETGKGTWHHLLDRLGAQRISNAYMIFMALAKRKIVTVLLQGHFVNIIGITKGTFIINDSARFNVVREEGVEDFLPKIKVAWEW